MTGHEDEGYQFAEKVENGCDGKMEENSRLPEYLLHALLSGLYYLPPEHILCHQLGIGRRVRYKTFNRIELQWKQVETNEGIERLSFLNSFEYAELPRRIVSEEGDVAAGKFRVYRGTLTDEIHDKWSDKLTNIALSEESTKATRLNVSNAGGYHSQQDLFLKYNSTMDSLGISLALETMICAIEKHDYDASVTSHVNISHAFGGVRKLQKVVDAEGWLNISRRGNYNRLHTHEGCCWSGCYYINNGCLLNGQKEDSDYGGFLLKPTPYYKVEETYRLTEEELARLNLQQVVDSDGQEEEKKNDREEKINMSRKNCDYSILPPVKGSILIVPSYLHHAVVPVVTEDALRISMAFNFSEAAE